MLHLSKNLVEVFSEAHELADDVVSPKVILPSHFLENGEEGLYLLDDERVG